MKVSGTVYTLTLLLIVSVAAIGAVGSVSAVAGHGDAHTTGHDYESPNEIQSIESEPVPEPELKIVDVDAPGVNTPLERAEIRVRVASEADRGVSEVELTYEKWSLWGPNQHTETKQVDLSSGEEVVTFGTWASNINDGFTVSTNSDRATGKVDIDRNVFGWHY